MTVNPDPVVATFTAGPIYLGDRFDAKVTRAPKPPRWRSWALFLRDWVARPAIGVVVRDVVEWLLGQLFRRRSTKAATS